MSFEVELRHYLERGIDLQHRRLEWARFKNGKQYQSQLEECVKWRQEVLVRFEGAPTLPATWGILPTYL